MTEVGARRRSRWGIRVAALLMVAVAAGLGAVALRGVLEFATPRLLGAVLVLHPVEGGLWEPTQVLAHDRRVALLPVMVAAGMILAVLISRCNGTSVDRTDRTPVDRTDRTPVDRADRTPVDRTDRTPVNGTDGVIAAINGRDLAGLDTRGAVVKLAGTTVTLGAGGSGGTEGPVVQVSASLAAVVARRLRLSEGESGLLVAAAMGAGVAALFQAPIGGALLAGELLRRRGIDWTALIVAIPAAFVAFGVFVSVYGYRPLFGAQLGGAGSWTSLALLAATGLSCGLLARVYVWTFGSTGRVLAPLRRWPIIAAAVGGAAVGAVGIVVPMTLGTGYGSVAAELSEVRVAAIPLWVLAILPLVKIAATAVTLQSGGVGGVFGPAMVIGASAGALCWRLAVVAGAHPGPVALFALTGLAATLGPAVRAPWAALLLATEASGNLLPPLGMLIAVAVAYRCAGGATLFPSQLNAQFPRRYRQLEVSVMLKSAAGVNRRWVDRMFGGVWSRHRKRSDPPGGGCAMEPETARGVPDLSDISLDVLARSDRPDIGQALRIALARRASAGIIFAGHSAGGA
ncbi:chloride channel protein [Nocardia sp. NPDC004711]